MGRSFGQMAADAYKKSVTYDSVAALVAEGKSDEAITVLLPQIDRLDRVKFCLTLLQNSPYRSYTAAINEFSNLILKVVSTQENHAINKVKMSSYLEKMATSESSGDKYSGFCQIRRLIITDLMNNSASSALKVIHYLNDTTLGPELHTKYLIGITADLCEILWQQGKTLKILYGI